ncbi:MAG: hypothetical protein ACI9N3_002878 [Colwellia sp.]|jgi:hypothetical protein
MQIFYCFINCLSCMLESVLDTKALAKSFKNLANALGVCVQLKRKIKCLVIS